MTPQPTLPPIKVHADTDTTKKISFPAYNVFFRIPNDLKTIRELDPDSESKQITGTFIALYTPDSVIDPKKHVQTAGAKMSINIAATNKKATNEQDLVPASSIKEAIMDTSVIPDNSVLITKNNTTVYSFPADKSAGLSARIYNAESLIKNGENMLDFTFYCVDYSPDKESPTCAKLLKEILPTLTIEK